MKNLRNLSIFLLSIFLFSCLMFACKHESYVQIYPFETFELNREPLKSLDSLETFRKDYLSMNKDQKMAYQLRYNLSRGKCFKPLCPRDKIDELIAYFSNRRDTKRLLGSYLLLAYHYENSTLSDSIYFVIQEALKLENIQAYPKELAHLYTLQGNAYYLAYFNKEAQKSYLAAYNLYESIEDSVMLALTCKDLGLVEQALDSTSLKTDSLFMQSIRIAEQIKDSTVLGFIAPVVISKYLDDDKMEQATRLFRKLKKNILTKLNYYSICAEYYCSADDYNRTKLYCDSLIALNTTIGRCVGYFYLYNTYYSNHDLKNAYDYLVKYVDCSETLNEEQRADKLHDIETKYQNDIAQQKTEHLRASNRQKSYLIIAIVVAAILLIYILIATYKARLATQKREAKANQEKLTQIITMLKGELLAATKAATPVPVEKLSKLEWLEKRQQQALTAGTAKMERENDVRKSALADKFRKVSEGVSDESIASGDWLEMQKQINQATGGLISELQYKVYKLNEGELRLCMLAKLEIPSKGMGILLNKKNSSISSMKSRIFEKITDQKGRTADFDGLFVQL